MIMIVIMTIDDNKNDNENDNNKKISINVTRIKTLDTDCHSLCSLSYTLTVQYCNHVHTDNYD